MTTATDRYYTDLEIACVAHQMLIGLDMMRGHYRLAWPHAGQHRQDLMVSLVFDIRRGASAAELYQAQCKLPAWEKLDRPERLRWQLLVLLVSAMAGEER